MIKNLLKFVFAAGIIYWLLKSGKLDLTLVKKSFSAGYYWLGCLGILVVQDIISAFRWKILLEIKTGKKLPVLAMIKLTWIGLFFNSFLPGAVTGDFIKLLYAKDLDPKLTKTFLVTSVLLDRIIGLIGLLFLLGLFSVVYFSEITGISPQLNKLLYVNSLLFLGVIFFFISLFLPEKIQLTLRGFAIRIPVIGNKIDNTLEQVWLIGKNKKAVLSCALISMVLQFMNVCALYTVSYPFIEGSLPLAYAFTFIPIGFIAVAIPISPAGLGVGHMAFDSLFGYFNISGGANFFNLYFISLVFINLFGFIPYILSGRKHSLKEAEEFGQEVTPTNS
ncbi:MAG: flippase-like domain-containing protein [Bacteriovoracaceae bacterium]|nr:flippase-like domain-containing protein [Bacteriovoracaceae bacterium]